MRLLTPFGDDNSNPFGHGLFNSVVTVHTSEEVKDGVLILWGGEDIGTSLYGQQPNKRVFRYQPSLRDIDEISLIQAAIKNDVPIIGICRGAQLACVVAGGKLVQHIDNHGRSHAITLHDEGDAVIQCNSSHHQMMVPPASAKVLATAKATTGLDENNKAITIPQVAEVVYFPSINALGIQPHPEWSNSPKDFNEYCVRKIKQYLL